MPQRAPGPVLPGMGRPPDPGTAGHASAAAPDSWPRGRGVWQNVVQRPGAWPPSRCRPGPPEPAKQPPAPGPAPPGTFRSLLDPAPEVLCKGVPSGFRDWGRADGSEALRWPTGGRGLEIMNPFPQTGGLWSRSRLLGPAPFAHQLVLRGGTLKAGSRVAAEGPASRIAAGVAPLPRHVVLRRNP